MFYIYTCGFVRSLSQEGSNLSLTSINIASSTKGSKGPGSLNESFIGIKTLGSAITIITMFQHLFKLWFGNEGAYGLSQCSISSDEKKNNKAQDRPELHLWLTRVLKFCCLFAFESDRGIYRGRRRRVLMGIVIFSQCWMVAAFICNDYFVEVILVCV